MLTKKFLMQVVFIFCTLLISLDIIKIIKGTVTTFDAILMFLSFIYVVGVFVYTYASRGDKHKTCNFRK